MFHHVAVMAEKQTVLWCQKIFGHMLKIFGRSPTEVWCPGQAGGWCAAAAAVYFEWRIKKRVGGCRQEEEGI